MGFQPGAMGQRCRRAYASRIDDRYKHHGFHLQLLKRWKKDFNEAHSTILTCDISVPKVFSGIFPSLRSIWWLMTFNLQ